MSLRSSGIDKRELFNADFDRNRVDRFPENSELPFEDYGGNMTSPQDQQEPPDANKKPGSEQQLSPKTNDKAGSQQNDGRSAKQNGEPVKQNESGKSDEEPKSDQILMNGSPFLGFLALCVNISGIYKTLCEIGVSEQSSDAAIFLAMKSQYLAKRSKHSLSRYFVKPTTVEYIQVRNFCYHRLEIY
jgi:hypothetical protein